MSALIEPQKQREFDYSCNDFARVVDIIYDISGIKLTDKKEEMVYSRLARRLRKMSLTRFSEYLDFMEKDKDERKAFVNALTTNLTHFFRENHHFEYFLEELIPKWESEQKKRIRIWSAGCSSGEEPYTLAMIWHALKSWPFEVDFKILATDLDTNVLVNAQQGLYTLDKFEPIEPDYMKWFSKTSRCSERQKEVSSILKETISFKQLNLMNDWPMKGPFQLIICRNVFIYFDKATQSKLIKRFYDLLETGGCLILGHSESLGDNSDYFQGIGKTIFRKLG